jgi:hypothetical protein
MTELTEADRAHAVRRAQRHAAAAALLTEPPPLDARPGHRILAARGDVVHASRSRPVVRWDLDLATGDGTRARLAVIGKAFVAGGGERAWWLLRELRSAGFDDRNLQVPEPLGFDPARQLLAQEEAPAGTLYERLRHDPDQALPEVGRVAEWLARLHAVPDPGLGVLPATFERDKLAEYSAALGGELPEHARRIDALTATTARRLGEAADVTRVVTHGDFQPKNIHLDDERVVVIDFDRAALASAARDLGHFVGQSLTMAASVHGHLDAAVSWARTFLRAYVTAGGDPRAVETTPGYVARTFAEVLYYRLVVRPVGTRAFVADWLDAWERHLEGGGAVS